MPANNRNRVLVVMSNVFLHLHPVKIRKSGIRLKFTWCMGGLTFFLFLVETFTGLLLMFYYRPTVAYAYMDIIDLAEQVPLGIMREIHRWGAHAMVITVWLHMFRVFMTGSYKPPREFNWNVGVILLVLTLLLSFTGYLLPWDQLAIWAITVGSNMARATPLLGHEGPGAQLLVLGDVKMVHAGSDARFALLGGRWTVEDDAGQRHELRIRGGTASLEVEQRLCKQCWISASVGANIFPNIRVEDGQGREQFDNDLKDGLVLSAGLKWVF